MQINTLDNRPPFVVFETVPIEDRASSQASGIMQYRDVDMIFITPHGSEGKTVLQYVYADWLQQTKRQLGPVRAAGGDAGVPFVMESRFPREWLDQIEKGYEAWKKGEELPIEGTPLKQWGALPPAALKTCVGNHIMTIEQLAAATDEALAPLGHGSRQWRNRAQDWVKINKEGEGARNAAEMSKLREDNAALAGQVATLTGQIADLLKRIPATEPQRTMELHQESQSGTSIPSFTGKKGK